MTSVQPLIRSHRLKVLVDLPRHAGLSDALDYRSDAPCDVGRLVRVPLGRRDVLGLCVECEPLEIGGTPPADLRPEGDEADDGRGANPLRPVLEQWHMLPPLDAGWLQLQAFASSYYQRGWGEMALSSLPSALKSLDGVQLQRRLKRLQKSWRGEGVEVGLVGLPRGEAETWPELTPEQADVLSSLERHEPATFLLHGVTGSGKTEVFLQEAERVMAQGRQVLLLVPEINLTPQLQSRVAARFPQRRLAVLHSGLTPAQRLQNWLAAHLGLSDIVLGTRMAVFVPLPRLGLIVVDEEHDPSYKQQDGARYSARDLAVYRGRQQRANVLLGSATPSLESWMNSGPAQEGGGRYLRLSMPSRIGAGDLPRVRLVDLNEVAAKHGKQAMREQPVAPELLEALHERLERGEQSLILLQRRGYAPVLHCTGCGWKSGCPHCSAWRVFHKADRTLRCHHCGSGERVPRACPDCGDPDIQPLGRGTERVEEQLAALLPQARIARIDADTTRTSGSLERQLAEVHDGDVDILVGTQMVAKGHDFRRMTLVAALSADAALFSSDFRAPERLFALLMQAGGRAGRDACLAARSEMWIQTWNPEHPVFAALRRHDYAAFAAEQLEERRQAGMPPYGAHALLRADAPTQESAQAFLRHAEAGALALQADPASRWGDVFVYAPVPATMQKIADMERAQMLLEAPSRALLQAFLSVWMAWMRETASQAPRVTRWAVDVDPLLI